MDKLILIDGNSLLNRAYYAMTAFSTKDGLPTNGIFGFIKLLFKILEDEKPRYLVVTFDVHAPTFRHKMYTGYKATRKPMPEDLAVQVPVLKDLLAAMEIRMLEMAGYEADDLIGTLSRMFPDTETLIYTGDRDSYQLIDGHTSVCMTKRGVSELDRMTQTNFYEKEGITPAQVVDMKALMGDNSDNIPGVRGIGPKGALALVQQYGTLDGVYEHLDEIAPAVQKKLRNYREDAYLSRRLAVIDTQVPVSLSLAECDIRLPFSEQAREKFTKLEFRSLVESAYFPPRQKAKIVFTDCTADMLPRLREAFSRLKEFAFTVEEEGIHVADGENEYLFRLSRDFLSPGFFLPELKEVLSALFSEGKTAILNDVKAVAHFLDGAGVSLSCKAEDVSLLRYLSDSNLRPSGAKELAKDFLLSPEHCACALLLAYKEAVGRENDTERKLYRELELPLAYVLLDMERTGVRVDMSKFPVFSDRFKGEMDSLSKRIYQLAGVSSFNLNSPFQLSEVLFERLGYSARGIKKNIRGGYSTSADVLEKLAEQHEIARLILRYREVQKLQSTYVDGIRPLVAGDIIHTTYYQTMTTTGRLSSANPNLQNIPVRTEMGRELRKLFIAREGNVLVDADYSQIELRLLAHFSRCKLLTDAYRTGKDIHAATAENIFHVPHGSVTPDFRRRAKVINFGIIYGMSAFGLAKDLGCSTEEAQRYISEYFAAHPEVKSYMDENVRLAKENGYVTTILGRKRFIPELKSGSFNQRAFGERAAMNMPLQGSAADIIKIAMLRVADRLKREHMASKLVLQVHDELILDAPEAEAEAAAKLLKEEMENAVSLNVPLIAEVSMGKSWYDAK